MSPFYVSRCTLPIAILIMIGNAMIIWRRLDVPGHEVAELLRVSDGYRLAGVALLAFDGEAHRVDYDIACDAQWSTRTVHVRSASNRGVSSLMLLRDAHGSWTVNGAADVALTGCIDADLGFSPSTNLLPIRRLSLAIGSTAEVRAAWVRYPELTVEVLEQRYTRLTERSYAYESADGAFRREITVDAEGFVIDYPGLWVEEARAKP